MAVGNPARIAVALVAVAAVVAFNQTSLRSKPAVLGTKLERCGVEGANEVPTGVRTIRAQRLTVTVAGGKPNAVLAPPVKIAPDASATPPPEGVSIELGVKGAGKARLSVTTVVRNATDCSIAVTSVRVSARQRAGEEVQTLVVFGGRERVVLAPRRRISGRAIVPAPRDGTWFVEATGSADVGASS